MITVLIQKWPIICLTIVMASPQYPMPYPMFGQPAMMPMMPGPPPAMMPMMPGPPPMMMASSSLMEAPPQSIVSILPPSPPLNMQMQIGLAIVPDEDATSTTTETTSTTDKSKNDEIAIAVPLPMSLPMPIPAPMPMGPPAPVLFAVPGMMSSVCKKNKKHPNCPPCPPCSCSPCTPSFFSYCSSCHQKCRCRNPMDVPLVPPPKPPFPLPGPAFPMPYPGNLQQSPNIAYIPYPPYSGHSKRSKKGKPIREYSDSESDSCENYKKKRNQKRPNKKYKDSGIYRRSNRRLDLDRSDNMFAKPVLNFLSADGKVRLERRLNKIDASLLMNDDNSLQNKDLTDVESYKKTITYPFVQKGRKKLVFRPPPNMMVGNLSVSFNTR